MPVILAGDAAELSPETFLGITDVLGLLGQVISGMGTDPSTSDVSIMV